MIAGTPAATAAAAAIIETELQVKSFTHHLKKNHLDMYHFNYCIQLKHKKWKLILNQKTFGSVLKVSNET